MVKLEGADKSQDCTIKKNLDRGGMDGVLSKIHLFLFRQCINIDETESLHFFSNNIHHFKFYCHLPETEAGQLEINCTVSKTQR